MVSQRLRFAWKGVLGREREIDISLPVIAKYPSHRFDRLGRKALLGEHAVCGVGSQPYGARMAFALGEYELAFQRFFSDAVHALLGAHEPLLADMEWETSPGATASVIQDQRGADVDLLQDPIRAETMTRRAPIRQGDFVELWLAIDDVARQIGRGTVKGLLGTLDTVTSATGNVVDAKGKVTFDAMLEAMEVMEWGLTDDDQLSMPTVVLHPDQLAKMEPPSPEQQKQLEELQDRKLSELLSRRRRRRLS